MKKFLSILLVLFLLVSVVPAKPVNAMRSPAYANSASVVFIYTNGTTVTERFYTNAPYLNVYGLYFQISSPKGGVIYAIPPIVTGTLANKVRIGLPTVSTKLSRYSGSGGGNFYRWPPSVKYVSTTITVEVRNKLGVLTNFYSTSCTSLASCSITW